MEPKNQHFLTSVLGHNFTPTRTALGQQRVLACLQPYTLPASTILHTHGFYNFPARGPKPAKPRKRKKPKARVAASITLNPAPLLGKASTSAAISASFNSGAELASCSGPFPESACSRTSCGASEASGRRVAAACGAATKALQWSNDASTSNKPGKARMIMSKLTPRASRRPRAWGRNRENSIQVTEKPACSQGRKDFTYYLRGRFTAALLLICHCCCCCSLALGAASGRARWCGLPCCSRRDEAQSQRRGP